jgi:hypothetical protein
MNFDEIKRDIEEHIEHETRGTPSGLIACSRTSATH